MELHGGTTETKGSDRDSKRQRRGCDRQIEVNKSPDFQNGLGRCDHQRKVQSKFETTKTTMLSSNGSQREPGFPKWSRTMRSSTKGLVEIQRNEPRERDSAVIWAIKSTDKHSKQIGPGTISEKSY